MKAQLPVLPKCLLITAARNEERHIERAIASMIAQTAPPAKWVIVDDGSTDRTADIVDRYAARYKWMERLDMPGHRKRNFAAKAHCFNTAWKSAGAVAYEIVGNVDADVSFEPEYIEFLLRKFIEMPKLGVAGTPFREDEGYDSSRDSFQGEYHVAGACQLFRQDCLADVGGYVHNASGGIDWIAVTTARMKGWETRSFHEKYFLHHRPLGMAERGRLASLFSYGEKDYYLGGSITWELFRVSYRMAKPPLVIGGIAIGLGYLSAAVRRMNKPVSTELMNFHRREQMKKLRAILKSLARMQKVDNFTLLAGSGIASKGRPSGDD